jgi:hypothetical protein
LRNIDIDAHRIDWLNNTGILDVSPKQEWERLNILDMKKKINVDIPID